MKTSLKISCLFLSILTLFIANSVLAEDDSAELAKKLANPIASLISVPLQSNWDKGFGSTDATRYTLNIQPVIPFSLGSDWNLITRTIVPIIDANSPTHGGDDSTGTGDILQSFFFSPKEPSCNGWIIGAGPALLYSTASEPELGARKWSAGPTAVFLKQKDGWTYGFLGNHLWSYAGEEDRQDINNTFAQPFLSYTTKTYTTFNLNTESNYDWMNDQWTIPLNLQISQLLRIKGQPVSIGLGPRYYAESPDGGAEWGARFLIQLLFPK